MTQDANELARLNTMIDQGRAKIEEALRRLHMVCPISTHPEHCNALWKKLKVEIHGPGLFAPSSAAAFHALAPQVERALQADVDTAMAANAKLGAIAAQVEQIYKGTRT